MLGHSEMTNKWPTTEVYRKVIEGKQKQKHTVSSSVAQPGLPSTKGKDGSLRQQT